MTDADDAAAASRWAEEGAELKRFGEERGKLTDNWKQAFELHKFPHNLDPWRIYLRKRWLLTLTFATMLLGNAGVLFGMGTWAYIERAALTPVFSRLACLNPQLLVPLSMSGPGGLVGKVNTTITCYNPNLFDARIHHDPPPELSYAVRPCVRPFCKGKPDVFLGNITYMDSKFTARETSTLTLLVDMHVPVLPASQITMDAGLPPKFAVLLLMVLNTEVTADAKFMFVQKPEHHLLPTKYCGFYAGIVVNLKNGVTGLGPKSETRCTNSRIETLELMENITIAEPALDSVLQWLDPTEEKQQYFKDLIMYSALGSMGISWGVAIGNMLLVFQLPVLFLLSPVGLPIVPIATSPSLSPGSLRSISSRSSHGSGYNPDIDKYLCDLEARATKARSLSMRSSSKRTSNDRDPTTGAMRPSPSASQRESNSPTVEKNPTLSGHQSHLSVTPPTESGS